MVNWAQPCAQPLGVFEASRAALALAPILEKLSKEKTQKLIEDYLFAEREPLRDEILELIEGDKPSVLQRKKLGDRILKKILGFVDTFINGIVG